MEESEVLDMEVEVVEVEKGLLHFSRGEMSSHKPLRLAGQGDGESLKGPWCLVTPLLLVSVISTTVLPPPTPPVPLLFVVFPAISLLRFSAFAIFSDLQHPHSSPLRLFKPLMESSSDNPKHTFSSSV